MKKEREFIITDGNKYIRKNFNDRYETVSDLTLADTFNSMSMAANVLRNEMTYVQKQQFYVAEIIGSKIVQHTAPLPKSAKERQQTVTSNDSAVSYSSDWVDEELLNGYQIVKDFCDFVKVKLSKKAGIFTELANLDDEFIDIRHIIEFTNQNACNSYKLENEAKEVLRKRRKLSNEKEIVNQIATSPEMVEQAEDLLKILEGLNNRVYVPRNRIDLFEQYLSKGRLA